jgi:hypothetical protein
MLNQTLVGAPTLRVLAIAAGLYAIYLPLAALLDRPVTAPRGGMVIRLTPIQPSRFGGFACEASLPEFRRFEGYSGPNLVPSPILLYEEDKPLGPSVHDNLWSIARTGDGRFSHWNHAGMFSPRRTIPIPGKTAEKIGPCRPSKAPTEPRRKARLVSCPIEVTSLAAPRAENAAAKTRLGG